MPYFRVLTGQFQKISELLCRDDSWLILINADPDAIGSSMALQRLLRERVRCVHIARINEISRPDNLAMIRNLRIPVKVFQKEMLSDYTKFALVDSQPHHSKLFEGIDFSIIIDHHPLPKKVSPQDSDNAQRLSDCAEQKMLDIRPDYGATCTMLTEYLYHANIRPGKYLATALQYGIRTDTGTFGRQCAETDLRAYHYLTKFADQNMLMRIIRSEYLPQWLPYFSRAFERFLPCGVGHFTYLSHVDSPDILVVVADFFLRVHGLKYIVVAGVYDKKIVCIFRGTNVNLGSLAQDAFSEYGSAGGHKAMARAEIPLANLKKLNPSFSYDARKKSLSENGNEYIECFLISRLKQFGTRKNLAEKKSSEAKPCEC